MAVLCLISSFLTVNIFEISISHPLCVDLRAPFQPSLPLEFCPQYSEFGCCNSQDDGLIKSKHENWNVLMSGINQTLWSTCSDIVRTILCQKCSPYSAHIFFTEAGAAFPGLCTDYCSMFFGICKNIVKYLYSDETDLVSAALADEAAFCNYIKPPDMDYCFPALLNNPALNGDIAIEQVTAEGCLCVEIFPNHIHFRDPVFVRHAGDGSSRLFIGEQVGVIWIGYQNGSYESEPFLDIQHLVLIETIPKKIDERGLAGLAFHPSFKENGIFFISYLTDCGDLCQFSQRSVLSRVQISTTNPQKANMSTLEELLYIPQPHRNHNSGDIHFGSDGYLYMSVGDGGFAKDPDNYAQNLSVLLGKMLRIDIDVQSEEGSLYKIPQDNPFFDVNGTEFSDIRPEIYAYGFRNPWRCSVDMGNQDTGEGKGRIFCGDVGQGTIEEVDLITAGGNFGWKAYEGNNEFDLKALVKGSTLVSPIYSYTHKVGKAVIGGFVYRGCLSPNLEGLYIYGDWHSSKLYHLQEINGVWKNKQIVLCGNDVCKNGLLGKYDRFIVAFGQDEDGEVYLLTSKSSSVSTKKVDHVYKIVDPFRRGDPASCRLAKKVTENWAGDAARVVDSAGMESTNPALADVEIADTVSSTEATISLTIVTESTPAVSELNLSTILELLSTDAVASSTELSTSVTGITRRDLLPSTMNNKPPTNDVYTSTPDVTRLATAVVHSTSTEFSLSADGLRTLTPAITTKIDDLMPEGTPYSLKSTPSGVFIDSTKQGIITAPTKEVTTYATSTIDFQNSRPEVANSAKETTAFTTEFHPLTSEMTHSTKEAMTEINPTGEMAHSIQAATTTTKIYPLTGEMALSTKKATTTTRIYTSTAEMVRSTKAATTTTKISHSTAEMVHSTKKATTMTKIYPSTAEMVYSTKEAMKTTKIYPSTTEMVYSTKEALTMTKIYPSTAEIAHSIKEATSKTEIYPSTEMVYSTKEVTATTKISHLTAEMVHSTKEDTTKISHSTAEIVRSTKEATITTEIKPSTAEMVNSITEAATMMGIHTLASEMFHVTKDVMTKTEINPSVPEMTASGKDALASRNEIHPSSSGMIHSAKAIKTLRTEIHPSTTKMTHSTKYALTSIIEFAQTSETLHSTKETTTPTTEFHPLTSAMIRSTKGIKTSRTKIHPSNSEMIQSTKDTMDSTTTIESSTFEKAILPKEATASTAKIKLTTSEMMLSTKEFTFVSVINSSVLDVAPSVAVLLQQKIPNPNKPAKQARSKGSLPEKPVIIGVCAGVFSLIIATVFLIATIILRCKNRTLRYNIPENEGRRKTTKQNEKE